MKINLNEAYFNDMLNKIKEFWSFNLDEKSFQGYFEIKFNEISLGIELSKAQILGKNEINRLIFAEKAGLINTTTHRTKIGEKIILILEDLKNTLNDLRKIALSVFTPAFRVYIPVLRTVISLFGKQDKEDNEMKLTMNVFRDTVNKHYDLIKETNDNLQVVTGLDLYENIKRMKNGEKLNRERFRSFENFLSETFFDNKEVEIVAKDAENNEEKNVIISIGDEERDIHNVGDGIQAMIIELFWANYLIVKYSIFVQNFANGDQLQRYKDRAAMESQHGFE